MGTNVDHDDDPPPRVMVVEVNGESTFREVDYFDTSTRMNYPELHEGEEVHFTIGGRAHIIKVSS